MKLRGNILNATGFVGRDSFDIDLGELSLADSVRLFGPSSNRLSTTEKLDILSLTGGVPKYLEEVRPEPRVSAIRSGSFLYASLEQLNGWDSILGLQFQNLILNNVSDLYPFFGLEHSLVLSAAPYVQNATKRNRGCQIDLLIQTDR